MPIGTPPQLPPAWGIKQAPCLDSAVERLVEFLATSTGRYSFLIGLSLLDGFEAHPRRRLKSVLFTWTVGRDRNSSSGPLASAGGIRPFTNTSCGDGASAGGRHRFRSARPSLGRVRWWPFSGAAPSGPSRCS
jgi:hypothetical protein